MSKFYSYVKVGVLGIDALCVLMSLLFLYQMEQRKTERYRAAISVLEEKNQILSEGLNARNRSLNDFLQEYERMQEEMLETEETMEEFKSVNDIRSYIDSNAAEIYRGRDGNAYIERYFRVERGELLKLIEEDTFPALPDAEEYGEFLPVGDGIWLRYQDSEEHALPQGIVINNPLVNIGYGEVKVGTEHSLIQREVWGESRQEEIRRIDVGENICYYLCLEDAYYQYYYLEIYRKPSILYITRNNDAE